MNVLVISPHPDDEVLGCGGLLHHLGELGEGHSITVLMVCNKRRTDYAYNPQLSLQLMVQSQVVQKKLGIREYIYCHLDDEELHSQLKSLRQVIEKTRDACNPDIIIVPSDTDLNQDHRTVYYAARIAFRPGRYDKGFTLMAYEALSATDQGDTAYDPNCWFKITQEDLDAKCDAMETYTSECTGSRTARGIKALAEYRGLQSGYEYAEAYRVLVQKGE